MALDMVKARSRKELLQNLQKDLSSGNISKMAFMCYNQKILGFIFFTKPIYL